MAEDQFNFLRRVFKGILFLVVAVFLVSFCLRNNETEIFYWFYILPAGVPGFSLAVFLENHTALKLGDIFFFASGFIIWLIEFVVVCWLLGWLAERLGWQDVVRRRSDKRR